ncbi:MAG: phosphatase PAP2 family protein [Solirubrobacteraceae bacterium]
MTRRSSRPPFLGALAGAGALVAVWAAAFHSQLAGSLDAATLRGYVGLDRGPVGLLAPPLAHLCDPLPFALLGALLVAVALVRRRPDLALGAGVLLAGASVTTQMLKPLLGAPRAADILGPVQVSLSSWPSGHSTAAMSLALAAVLVAPPSRRPLVAAAGGCFAVAVPSAVLVLGWHFPSDVLAGYLVAGTWALAVLAALWALPSRARAAAGGRARIEATIAPTVVAAAAVAAAAGLAVLARPEAAIAYAHDHTTFVAAAVAIATAGLAFASGLAVALRRPGA